MKEVLKKVLEDIKPSKQEELEVKKVAKQILSKIKIKGVKPVLGGSGEKGTWLRNTHDIDVYVKFDPKKHDTNEISQILKKLLIKTFKKVDTLHGSRDYYRVYKEGYTIEIVPILDIKTVKEAQNITDISPFHAEWVKKYGKGDEIRLAKAFCKAQYCYGAESYIQGFSGYVLEILVTYYGSFENFIKNVARWKPKESIDIEKHGVKLNQAKTYSPLILIDPVQDDRNAAAALSKEKYNKLIQAARKFLQKPSEEMFEKKEITIEDLRRKAKDKNLILLGVKPLRGKEDVIGAKLVKALEYLRRQLILEDFKVYDYGWKWNKEALFWLIIDKEELPEFKEHQGPKLEQKKHVENFKLKNKEYELYEKNGRIYAKTIRVYRRPEELVKKLVVDDNFKTKVLNAKVL